MAPFYRGFDPNLRLGNDDINGIQFLYGEPINETEAVTTEPTAETTRRPIATPPPAMPDFCANPRIDAMALHEMEGVERFVAFVGDHVAVMDGNGIMEGYPKATSELFQEVQGEVTAAVYSEGFSGWRRWRYINYDSVTILFTATQFYVYKADQTLVEGYPRPLSDLGIDSPVDAAFVWFGNGAIYLMTEGRNDTCI